MTVKELCDYLKVHRDTVYRLLNAGKIRGFRLGSGIGSDWRFRRKDIDRWIAEGKLRVE
jgi:excisionase family DNA binding protein